MAIRYSFTDPPMASRKDRPAELDTAPLDLGDGLARNVRKVVWEFRWARAIDKVDDANHGGLLANGMNSMVVYCRHAPFAVAHVAAVALPVILVTPWLF